MPLFPHEFLIFFTRDYVMLRLVKTDLLSASLVGILMRLGSMYLGERADEYIVPLFADDQKNKGREKKAFSFELFAFFLLSLSGLRQLENKLINVNESFIFFFNSV